VIYTKPAPWSLSPGGVELGWEHFWRNAKIVLPIWDATHTSFDYAGRRFGNLADPIRLPSRAFSQLGLGSNFPTGFNYKWIFPLRPELHNTNRFTVLAMVSKPAWGAVGGIAGMFSNASRYFALWSDFENIFNMQSYISSVSQFARTGAHASYFDGTPTCVVGTQDITRNDVYAAKPLTLADYDTGADPDGGTRNSTTTQDFAVGSYQAAAGGNQWNGDILFLAYLPGIAWSAEQAKAWMRDPYGPIRQRRRVWARVPAADGGGLAIPIAAYHYNHHLGSMAS